MSESEVNEPTLRIVSGYPTDEELAALVAVLAARAGSAGSDEPEPHSSAWSAPSRLMRPVLHPGADAWRRSAFRS